MQHSTQQKSMKMFIVLLGGQFISSIGSGLTDFGLAVYVLRLTNSVSATAIISICAFLPTILLTPLGGILADRYDRRLMMMTGELFSGLGLVICLVSILSSQPSMLMICIGVAISSVFAALMEPAFKATLTDMISEEDFAKAGGLVQIANNAKLLISPALAGLLLRFTPVSTLLMIDILTFVTTVFTIAFVRKHIVLGFKVSEETESDTRQRKQGLGIELKEGIDALSNTRGIWTLVGIMTLAVFCLGFVQILSKPMILAYATESELGTLTTVVAVGMLVGSIVISCMKRIKAYHRLLAFGLVGCGLFMALMGIRENIVLTAGFGFMMFVFMPIVQIAAEVMVRTNLQNEVQGRAFGVIGFVSQMGYIVAYLCSGFLADYVFEPFMCGSSSMAAIIGSVLGHGIGRGIALLVILAGAGMVVVGFMVIGSKRLRDLGMLTSKSRLGEKQ